MPSVQVNPFVEGNVNKEKIPKHEQDYWDTWANVLPFPKGVVHDAESYKKAIKEEKEKKK